MRRHRLDLAATSTLSVEDMSDLDSPVIDRTIYPMPMFATFPVADILAAEDFYHAVGFVSLATIPGPGGAPMLVHLRRMRYQDLLLVPGRPQPGSATVSFAAGGQDLGRLAGELRARIGAEGGAGAGGVSLNRARIEGPTDTPWFTVDLTIDDPDGNRVVLTAPREAEMDRAKVWVKDTFKGDFIVAEEAPGEGAGSGEDEGKIVEG